MKITFLGVAGALSAKYNSNMLLEGYGLDDSSKEKNFVMLFDCGEDVMHSLASAGRKPEEIDAVYISHLHMDHCGGLSWLAYYTYFIMNKKLPLYLHETMVTDIWSMLRPSMEKLDKGDRLMTLNDYFDVKLYKENTRFNVGGMQFYPVKQKHVETNFGDMDSYGLKGYRQGDWCGYQEVDKEHIHDGRFWRFFISSDSKKMFIPSTNGEGSLYPKHHYDYMFCDCDVMNLSGVHPNYDDLKDFPNDTRSRMWLYHYTNLDDYEGKFGEMPDAVADGFAGFVEEGQVFSV
jgi:hypothetical protein